jgi:F-type H+-transporting ATPase subunit alpha
MVELLKQPQFQPLSAEREVIVLFAGTRGYLDKYPVPSVLDYERKLLEFIEARHRDILDEIADKKDISADLEARMRAALDEFVEVFSRGAVVPKAPAAEAAKA